MQIPLLSIVVPCYNEEQVLPVTLHKLLGVLNELIAENKISSKSFLLFVDDGSNDKTWKIIENSSNENVNGIKLSKNFGHQSALLAGLMEARKISDCVISIDADLQQDEGAIHSFIDKYYEGCDIVYGVRTSRNTDSFFKKTSAGLFYNMMKFMGVNLLKNSADYRLLSKVALNSLSEYTESNLFLRGIFPLLGYKSDIVYHDVRERYAGKSKYTLKKMLSFALNGIVSFSIVPVRVISIIGFIISLLSIIIGLYYIGTYFSGTTIPGWASTVIPIYFIGGMQIMSIGIIGEYVARTYFESKKRPKYLIEKNTLNNE